MSARSACGLLGAIVISLGLSSCKVQEQRRQSRPDDSDVVVPKPPSWPDATVPRSGSRTDTEEQDSCEPGLLSCDDECVDPATSQAHCGRCDNACSSGTECVQRRCTLACTSNTQRCGASCVNVSTDVRNCGACGTVCFPDQVCNAGQCGCAADKAACAGVCVVRQQGLCGPCGNTCPADLPCADGADHTRDWPTLGGDMSRSGYNAGERGTPPLSPDWAVSVVAGALNPVVVSGARVFVSGEVRTPRKSMLVALELASGATLWSQAFASEVSAEGQPSVVDCRVYVHNGLSGSGQVTALRADTGEVVWTRGTMARSEQPAAPTVTATGVYVGAGSSGALLGFARSNGAELFRSMEGLFEGALTASHGAYLYTYSQGQLRRYAGDAGAVLDTIGVKWGTNSGSVVSFLGPAFSPDGVAYFVAPPTLFAFEALSKKLLWSHAANVSGAPAVAEGRVLALDSQLLSAFDAKTGALAWRNLDAEGLVRQPVVAAGFAYVSSQSKTYALDLRDGSVVWQANVAGWLSLGGGRLFIATADGILHAYRLTQPTPTASSPAELP